jgi:opacity protein-like surface antigen
MKKTLLGVAAAALVAGSAGAHVFKGPYVGAQVGYAHNSTDMKVLSGNGLANDVKRKHSASSATFMVLAGYSDLWNADHLYGAELRVGYDTFSRKKGGDKLKMDWTVGGRLRYGFIADRDWLPFVTLGVDYSHGNYQYNRGNESSLKDNFRVWEVVPGLGVEWSLNETVNFRADYEFAFAVNDRGLNAQKAKVHNGPHRHHVRVGAVFNF